MTLIIIVALIALIVGATIGTVLGGNRARVNAADITAKIEKEAREHCDTLERQARENAEKTARQAQQDAEKTRVAARTEAENIERSRRADIDKTEQRLNDRQEKLDARASALDEKQNELRDEERRLHRMDQSLTDRIRNVSDKERDLDDKISDIGAQLERIAELTKEQARAELIEDQMEIARIEAAKRAKKLEDQIIDEADKRAKKILATTIQRYAGEYVSERCVTVINLPSDDMKGRIIGREGRNIRAIEAATGCDLIIDDTPEAIVVSGFDPTRREIARQSLERLIADGRIHPARIEEVVQRTTDEMQKTLREAGEQAAFELGISDLHPEITYTLGRLKYRTSYGQNMWSHSIEVGFLCGLMAAELGLNVKVARRAGLLHDIGKAIDHEQEGGHAIIGANLIKKHGESDLVVNAVAAHHEEVPAESIIAHLVMAADALSGARPGARREILESYVQRIRDLETLAGSFNGVRHAYAIQAGREIRVMVENKHVSDEQATLLSRDIARKIEDEMTYPGQITVTVIREVRAAEIAR